MIKFFSEKNISNLEKKYNKMMEYDTHILLSIINIYQSDFVSVLVYHWYNLKKYILIDDRILQSVTLQESDIR